jgi:hypothetical protein
VRSEGQLLLILRVAATYGLSHVNHSKLQSAGRPGSGVDSIHLSAWDATVAYIPKGPMLVMAMVMATQIMEGTIFS